MKYPGWLLFLPLLGCSLPVPTPPSAEFLVADAGSTYWVRSGPHGVTARTSPLILTSADNRFYEVYVDEVTRSYDDAIFTGEPIYSRDLLTGRKKLLWEESKVAAWEKAYLTRNPAAHLLDPEDEGSEDVSVSASGESDILAVVGPYVLYDRRVTLERDNFQASDSSRGAIDIRSGTAIALDAVVKDSSILGAGAVREDNRVRWRHSGYDVIARWDDERGESEMVIRDLRGHEWALGYVGARLPRIYWLDQPRVDVKLRSALASAFDDARADDVDAQLVRGTEGLRPRRVAENGKLRLVSYTQ
jgi:hypothetical protein